MTSSDQKNDDLNKAQPEDSSLKSPLVCTTIDQIDLTPLSPCPPQEPSNVDAILLQESPAIQSPVLKIVKNMPGLAVSTGPGNLNSFNPTTTSSSTNSTEAQPIDYASLVKPLDDICYDKSGSNSGVRQILSCLAADSPSTELLNALINECDLVYECRMCRSLHRALPNFLAHKRFYCRDLYADRGKRAIDAACETRLNQSNWAAFLRSSHHYGQSRKSKGAATSPGASRDDDRRHCGETKPKVDRVEASSGKEAAAAATFKTRSFWKRLGQGTSPPAEKETKMLSGNEITQTTSSNPSFGEDIARRFNEESRTLSSNNSLKQGRNKRKTSLPKIIKHKQDSSPVLAHVGDSQKSSMQSVPGNELPRLKLIPTNFTQVTASDIVSPYEKAKGIKIEHVRSNKACNPVTDGGEPEPLSMTIPTVELNPTLKCLDCSDSVTYSENCDFIEHLSSQHSPQGFNIKCPLCPHFMFNLASLLGHIGMFHRKEGLVNVFKALRERSLNGNLLLRPKSVQGLARERYANLSKTRASVTNQLFQPDSKQQAPLESPSHSLLIDDAPLRRGKRGRPMLPKNTVWTSKFKPFNRYSKGSRYSQGENYHTGPTYACQGCGKRFKNLKIKMRHAVFCPSSQSTPRPLSPGEVRSPALASNSMTRLPSARASRINVAPYTNIQKAKVLDLFSDPSFCQKTAADVFNPANLHLIDNYYNCVTLECKICDRRFNNNYTMARHMFRHFDIYRFKCQVCHFGSYDKCEIYSHITDCHVPHPLSKRECRRAIIDIRHLPLSEQRCSNAVVAMSSSTSINDLSKPKESNDREEQMSIGLIKNRRTPFNPHTNYSKTTSSESKLNLSRKRRYDETKEDNSNEVNVLVNSPGISGQVTSKGPINGSEERRKVGRPPLKVKKKAGRPCKKTECNVPDIKAEPDDSSNSTPTKPNLITSTIIKTYNEETGALTSSFQRLKQELGATNDPSPTDVTHGSIKPTLETSCNNTSTSQNNSLGAAARKKFESALAKATAPLTKSSPIISPRRRGTYAQSNASTPTSHKIERASFVPVGDVKMRCSEAQTPRFTTIRILSGGKVMSPPYNLSLGANPNLASANLPVPVPRLLFQTATPTNRETKPSSEQVASLAVLNNEETHNESPLKQHKQASPSPPRSPNNLVIPQMLYLRASSNQRHPNGDI